jgi:hypothetical protein
MDRGAANIPPGVCRFDRIRVVSLWRYYVAEAAIFTRNMERIPLGKSRKVTRSPGLPRANRYPQLSTYFVVFSALFLCLAATSFAANPASKDGAVQGPLAVIVHKSSTAENVSLADLRKILTGDLRGWSDSSPLILVQQPDDGAVQQRILKLLLKTTPAAYNRQLLQIQFQGHPAPAIKVLNSEPNAIGFVWNVPGSISIVDASAAAANSSHVKLIKVDGKLPGDKGYPLQ